MGVHHREIRRFCYWLNLPPSSLAFVFCICIEIAMAPRVVFPVMEPGTRRIGLRAVRREFGAYGDIFNVSLRLDRFRQPESVEIEFIEERTALKVKDRCGAGSDLALYRAASLVDASRRDTEAAFLCTVDNFGQGADAVANTF